MEEAITQTVAKNRYDNIDGLRAIAAIGVILMHVLSNGNYIIGGGYSNSFIGYIINHLISSFGVFVQLFFLISGFAMCCGYYEEIKNNALSLDKFYKRRYAKILPFFALLVVLDLFISLIFDGTITIGSIYEAFADLTLAFGLLPASDISVIGVGWTLGVIFGFYILFPFFVWLIWDKKRAWFVLVLALIMNYVCAEYFLSNGVAIECNVLRWLCYFIAGGIIYLYKEDMGKLLYERKWLSLLLILIGFIVVFVVPSLNTNTAADTMVNTLKTMIGFSLVLIGSLTKTTKILYNPVSKFISGISLEIYLAHMVVFRAIDKVGLVHIFSNDLLSYIFAAILVIAGVVLFAFVYKQIEKFIIKRYRNFKDKKMEETGV